MAFPTVRIADPLTRPGQTAAFTIRYGEPRCAVPGSGRPALVAVVDGQRRRLPLRVEDPGLLRRLRAKACAGQRLDAVAGVTLRLEPRTVRVGRAEYVPGAVVLSRRPGATGVVRLVDLGGSVLLVLVPRGGASALPGRLGPGSARTAFPVLLGSAHRCDAHARGQSSQTFLISAYVRLDDAPTQRVVLPLSSAERDRLLGLIDRDCGTAEGS
jgi:hypothetical protein